MHIPTYATRIEAITRGIVPALNASGMSTIDIDADVDLDGLADAVVTSHVDANGQAYYMIDVDEGAFWQAVAAHDHGHVGPRDGEDAPGVNPETPAGPVQMAFVSALHTAAVLRLGLDEDTTAQALPLHVWQYETICAVLDGDPIAAAEAVAGALDHVAASASEAGA